MAKTPSRAQPDDEMTFRAAVEGRASVRRFRDEPVPREDVREMVRLATRAASAGNAQMWRFVAVDDPRVRAAMRAAVDGVIDEMTAWPEVAAQAAEVEKMRPYATFFGDAPVVVAVFALPYESRADRLLAARGLSCEERDRLRQRPDLQSVGGAVQLLITAAQAIGYGACWMSAPVLAAERLEELLGVKPPARLVALVPLGRPRRPARPGKRLPLDEVLRFL
jgi:nitroreductase